GEVRDVIELGGASGAAPRSRGPRRASAPKIARPARAFRRSLRDLLECDLVAEDFEPADEVSGQALRMKLIEMHGTKVTISLPALEHVVEYHQQRMSDRHEGSLTPSAP